jgi:hypothetical protein
MSHKTFFDLPLLSREVQLFYCQRLPRTFVKTVFKRIDGRARDCFYGDLVAAPFSHSFKPKDAQPWLRS